MLNIITLLRLQTPTGTPKPGSNTPIDLSEPFDIIVYIVMPIVIIAVFFILKKKKKGD